MDVNRCISTHEPRLAPAVRAFRNRLLTVNGNRVIFKIDYLDRSRRIHSPDPADPKVTVRVMTVMLADEY